MYKPVQKGYGLGGLPSCDDLKTHCNQYFLLCAICSWLFVLLWEQENHLLFIWKLYCADLSNISFITQTLRLYWLLNTERRFGMSCYITQSRQRRCIYTFPIINISNVNIIISNGFRTLFTEIRVSSHWPAHPCPCQIQTKTCNRLNYIIICAYHFDLV